MKLRGFFLLTLSLIVSFQEASLLFIYELLENVRQLLLGHWTIILIHACIMLSWLWSLLAWLIVYTSSLRQNINYLWRYDLYHARLPSLFESSLDRDLLSIVETCRIVGCRCRVSTSHGRGQVRTQQWAVLCDCILDVVNDLDCWQASLEFLMFFIVNLSFLLKLCLVVVLHKTGRTPFVAALSSFFRRWYDNFVVIAALAWYLPCGILWH